MKMDAGKTYQLSIGVSIIMIIMYIAALLFKLVTHRGVYQHKSDEVAHEEEPEWSKGKRTPYFSDSNTGGSLCIRGARAYF